MAVNIRVDTLTQDKLKSLLHYDPVTGIFKWQVVNSNRVTKDKIAGNLHKFGYVIIRIDRLAYRAHRLAFLYMTGNWPKHELDHINRVRNDNRWDNLREATRSENAKNLKMFVTNTSGFKGVSFDKTRSLWRATGRHNNQYVTIGRYKSIEDAVLARISWATEQHKDFYCSGAHHGS